MMFLYKIFQATSDALFNFPAYLISQAWTRQRIPTFFYSFDHVGKLQGVRKLLKGSLLVDSNDNEESEGKILYYLSRVL